MSNSNSNSKNVGEDFEVVFPAPYLCFLVHWSNPGDRGVYRIIISGRTKFHRTSVAVATTSIRASSDSIGFDQCDAVDVEVGSGLVVAVGAGAKVSILYGPVCLSCHCEETASDHSLGCVEFFFFSCHRHRRLQRHHRRRQGYDQAVGHCPFFMEFFYPGESMALSTISQLLNYVCITFMGALKLNSA